uniref:OCIA domain containing 2 n=1 Tax=Hippocampus comes TaxID=109280 RepID=A0A3Q2Z0R8_HIPCM
MSTEVSVKKENATKGEWKCPTSQGHIPSEDVRKVWKECQQESFWYRALPLSVGSMAVTGTLIYNGIWKTSKRFGPFPKLAGMEHDFCSVCLDIAFCCRIDTRLFNFQLPESLALPWGKHLTSAPVVASYRSSAPGSTHRLGLGLAPLIADPGPVNMCAKSVRKKFRRDLQNDYKKKLNV